MTETNRRAFLIHAGLGASSLVVGSGCLTPDCDPAVSPCGLPPEPPEPTDPPPDPCDPTEDNIEGPFYREDAPLREDLNVTEADGDLLTITGRVYGEGCDAPLVGAIVDVWHCGPEGDYDNVTDEFEFRGQAITDSEGRYRFETVFPGRYLNNEVFRPAHVHYKVSAEGHVELTTQLYFEGDPYLEGDPWALESLTQPAVEEGDRSVTSFDIVLAVDA